MTEQKDIKESLVEWYDEVVSRSSRVTSGNLSHNIASLKCYLSSVKHLIKRFYPDNELALKHSNTFNNLAEKCDRITTGNVTHEIAGVKGCALNYSYLFQELLKEEIK